MMTKTDLFLAEWGDFFFKQTSKVIDKLRNNEKKQPLYRHDDDV